MFDGDNTDAQHVRNIERRLSDALDGIEFEIPVGERAFQDLSSRELLQMAWDRAEREIDELHTELRILQQRHREAERRLAARINQRKRLQQQILDAAGESPLAD